MRHRISTAVAHCPGQLAHLMGSAIVTSCATTLETAVQTLKTLAASLQPQLHQVILMTNLDYVYA